MLPIYVVKDFCKILQKLMGISQKLFSHKTFIFCTIRKIQNNFFKFRVSGNI